MIIRVNGKVMSLILAVLLGKRCWNERWGL